jgi:hypothetical protein
VRGTSRRAPNPPQTSAMLAIATRGSAVPIDARIRHERTAASGFATADSRR